MYPYWKTVEKIQNFAFKIFQILNWDLLCQAA